MPHTGNLATQKQTPSDSLARLDPEIRLHKPRLSAEIQTPVDMSICGEVNYGCTIVVFKIFEISMPGEVKGTLTAEEVKRSAVQSTLILIFEEKECSFVVRPEFKVFSSKGTQIFTLTNVIKGVLCVIFHANLAPRKNPNLLALHQAFWWLKRIAAVTRGGIYLSRVQFCIQALYNTNLS